MNSKMQITMLVSKAGHEAFHNLATEKGVTASGLFRQFLHDLFKEYGEQTSGLSLPAIKIRPSKQRREPKYHQLATEIFHKDIFDRLKRVALKQHSGGFFSLQEFLRVELSEWLEIQHGISIKEVDLRPGVLKNKLAQ